MSKAALIGKLYRPDEAAELLGVAQPIHALSRACIYFLLHNGEVVYVGQSTSVYARLQVHMADKRELWDSYVIHECAAEDLNDLELRYYEKFLPKYNRVAPTPPNRNPRKGKTHWMRDSVIQRRMKAAGVLK